MSSIKTIPVDRIIEDAETQIREQLDDATVDRYVDAAKRNEVLPPIIVVETPEGFVIADGHHRYRSALKRKAKSIRADVRQGDRHTAIDIAVEENEKNGLPLSNADKRRVVTLYLKREPDSSDRSIAERVRVSPSTVGSVRAQVSNLDTSATDDATRTGKDGKTYPASKPTRKPVVTASDTDGKPTGPGAEFPDSPVDTKLRGLIPDPVLDAFSALIDSEGGDGVPDEQTVRDWQERFPEGFRVDVMEALHPPASPKDIDTAIAAIRAHVVNGPIGASDGAVDSEQETPVDVDSDSPEAIDLGAGADDPPGVEPFHGPTDEPEPDSLSGAQARVDRAVRLLKSAREGVRSEFQIKGTEVGHPWLAQQYSFDLLIGTLNQLIREVEDLCPVGGTAKNPQTKRSAKAQEAASK